MQNIFTAWLSLAVRPAFIGAAGARLSHHDGIIAEKNGLAGVGPGLRPGSRVFRTVSRISLLMMIYLPNPLFLCLYGH